MLKRLNRTLRCEGTILDMYADTMQLPDGNTAQWDFISYKHGGGACIVPVLDDDSIVMIRQYRPAIDRYTLELPAGTRDRLADGTLEDASITAARELEEETGYKAGSISRLLSLRSAVAYCDEMTEVFLAEGLVQTGRQHLDEAEEIQVMAVKTDVLQEMIFSGTIQDAKTAAGIMAYLLTV